MTLFTRKKFLVRGVADATLGKNPDDGLYKKYCSLSGLFLLAAADAPLSREINFLLEGVRLGLSQKKTPRDSTQTYSPRGLTFSDGPRMTPYHNKYFRMSYQYDDP